MLYIAWRTRSHAFPCVHTQPPYFEFTTEHIFKTPYIPLFATNVKAKESRDGVKNVNYVIVL